MRLASVGDEGFQLVLNAVIFGVAVGALVALLLAILLR